MKILIKIMYLFVLITTIPSFNLLAQVKILSTVDSLIIETFKGKKYDFPEYKLFSKEGSIGVGIHNSTPPDYEVDEYKRDSIYILVLTNVRSIDSLTKNLCERKILDIIAFSFNRDKMILVEKWCKCNGTGDASIFAVVENTFTQWFEHIYAAWRVNKQQGRFEELSTQGIECENMGYGD